MKENVSLNYVIRQKLQASSKLIKKVRWKIARLHC